MVLDSVVEYSEVYVGLGVTKEVLVTVEELVEGGKELKLDCTAVVACLAVEVVYVGLERGALLCDDDENEVKRV